MINCISCFFLFLGQKDPKKYQFFISTALTQTRTYRGSFRCFLLCPIFVLPNNPEVLLVSLLHNLIQAFHDFASRHSDLHSSDISTTTNNALWHTWGTVGHQILEHNLNSVLHHHPHLHQPTWESCHGFFYVYLFFFFGGEKSSHVQFRGTEITPQVVKQNTSHIHHSPMLIDW